MKSFPTPPWPEQSQQSPGSFQKMDPRPDHGESSYAGTGQLEGKVAIITGADSGIGRAVAIAYAREGADVVIGYLDEDADARDTAQWVEKAGRRAVLVKGDIAESATARALVGAALESFGKLDVLVNNAGHQVLEADIEKIDDATWRRHFDVNVHGAFYLVREALEHLEAGASIIFTSSQNALKPLPTHVPYAATKAALNNLVANFAQKWADRGIRVNSVMPGATWTPLIASSNPAGSVQDYGSDALPGRPAQPAEYASAYVMFASDSASYTSGAMLAITGGTVML